jgi:hypothetical protein
MATPCRGAEAYESVDRQTSVDRREDEEHWVAAERQARSVRANGTLLTSSALQGRPTPRGFRRSLEVTPVTENEALAREQASFCFRLTP